TWVRIGSDAFAQRNVGAFLMATPVPTADEETVLPSPLVTRVFGEPRFHTDGDVAGLAFAANGKQLSRCFLSDLETLWCFGPDAQLLASGNDDLLLWDAASGQLLRRLPQ